jgi:hypothetical protein
VRIFASASALTVLTVSITAFSYLAYFEPGPLSRQKKQETAAVIEMRSSIAKQYPTAIIFDAESSRVLNPTVEEKSDAMAASERKTLMYAIKRIHDPLNDAQ